MDTHEQNDAFESNLQRSLPSADSPVHLGDDAKSRMTESLVTALEARRVTYSNRKKRRILALAISSLGAAAVLLIAFQVLQEKEAAYQKQQEKFAAAPVSGTVESNSPTARHLMTTQSDIDIKMGLVADNGSAVPGARYGGVSDVQSSAAATGTLPAYDGSQTVVSHMKIIRGKSATDKALFDLLEKQCDGVVTLSKRGTWSFNERENVTARQDRQPLDADMIRALKSLGYMNTGPALTEEEAERLAALGYVGGSIADRGHTVKIPPDMDIGEESSLYASESWPFYRRIPVPGTVPFTNTANDVRSTFATDVDEASYTLARQRLLVGFPPLPSKVRSEEFINYFRYDYPPPTDEDFAIHLDAAPSPFHADAGLHVMRVALQGRVVEDVDRKPAVLTFVIDVSGSMQSPRKIGLARDALRTLVAELRPDDAVAIVSFADDAVLELEHTPLSNRETILQAIDALELGGSTNAAAGLKLGYETAEAGLVEGAINRVVLCSDGVANTDETSADGILDLVNQHIAAGITLTSVGIGMGTYNDRLMERLADKGDGQCFFVDDATEARRVFVHELTGTLELIARDAKVQVEFNPDLVSRFRLIGYDNRLLPHEAFDDDTTDAGEIGAGHQVTALYEIALNEAAPAATDEPIATVRLRYESERDHEIHEQEASLFASAIAPSFEQSPMEFQWAVAIGEWAEMLQLSDHVADTDPQAVADLLETLALDANEASVAQRTEAAALSKQSVVSCNALRAAVREAGSPNSDDSATETLRSED